MGAIGMAESGQRRRRRLLRRARAMLTMDMAPRALAWHAIKVMGLWAPIVFPALYVDASLHGGPVAATLSILAGWLIPVGLLHVKMFRDLLKDKKLDEMIAKNEERWAKNEEDTKNTQAMLQKIMGDLAAMKDSKN